MAVQGVITVANEQVSIVTVCQLLGVELPDDIGTGRSRKVHCPFGGLYHSDAGLAPAMRIYPDSNSAYCFSCAAYFSPVSLAAQGMDCDRRTAAVRLLDRAGIAAPDLAQAWVSVRDYAPQPDRALLAAALKTYCRRIDPLWSSRQFDAAVAARLSQCLAVLDLVHTDQDVQLWLSRCKATMHQTLICDEPSSSDRNDVMLGVVQDDGKGTTS